MTKNKTILIGLILAVFIISMVSLASAEDYKFTLRQTESADQEFNYTNNAGETVNITFSVENLADKYTATSANRDTIDFTFAVGSFLNVVDGDMVTDTLTVMINNAAAGTYTASLIATLTHGTVASTVLAHDLEIVVSANNDPTINGLENLNIEVGSTSDTVVTILDADNDSLTVALENAPASMSLTDNLDDTWTINWAPTSAVSETTVTLAVSDGFVDLTPTFTATAYVAGTSLYIPEMDLGSTNQERELLTQTFTLSNTGSEAIADLNVQIIANDLDFVISQPPAINIAPGASTSMVITLDIPLDQDSGSDDIGSLIFNYNGLTETKTVALTTKSLIDFYEDVEYEVNSDGDENLDQGENIDVEPDDTITINFKLESLADIEFDEDNIEVRVECDDFEYDEDDTSTKTLEDEGDKTNEFEFVIDVPYDADEDSSEASITVEAEDEHGATHTLELTFDIEVDKPSHSIRIVDVSFVKSTVSAGARVQLEIEIENAGTNDEERVYIEVQNSNLDIEERFGPYEIDEDDDLERTITIDIPEDADEDEYIFLIETFYNMDRESDDEQITLTVYNDDYQVTPIDDEDEDESIVIIPNQDNILANPVYGEPISKGLFGEDTITILLVILIAVIVGLIVVVLIPGKK